MYKTDHLTKVQSETPYTLNVNGQLLSLQRPVVMGILNVTTESFYAQSRVFTTTAIEQRAKEILDEGAAIFFVVNKVRDKMTPAIGNKVQDLLDEWFGPKYSVSDAKA